MNILLILKGFIVGLGKIIPGVSGSMLAYTLGIYEDLINAVTCFFNNLKKHLKILINFGIGVFLAIILFSKLILFLLNNYYNETMYLFLGLIIGTILPFAKNLKINKKNIIIFLITFMIFLTFTYTLEFDKYIFKSTLFDYIYTIFLGGVDAATSIIPGISGTAIFMLLGSYEYVLNILANPFSLIFILYGIGLLIGIILICYLMNYLLKNKKEETNSFVFALMLASTLILLFSLTKNINIFLIILFLIGIFIGNKFDK